MTAHDIRARKAFQNLSADILAFDGAVMAGCAIIFGMLSRETLERLAQGDIGTHGPHTGKDLVFAVSSVPRVGTAEGTSAVAMVVAWLKRNIRPIFPVTLGDGNTTNHC